MYTDLHLKESINIISILFTTNLTFGEAIEKFNKCLQMGKKMLKMLDMLWPLSSIDLMRTSFRGMLGLCRLVITQKNIVLYDESLLFTDASYASMSNCLGNMMSTSEFDCIKTKLQCQKNIHNHILFIWNKLFVYFIKFWSAHHVPWTNHIQITVIGESTP